MHARTCNKRTYSTCKVADRETKKEVVPYETCMQRIRLQQQASNAKKTEKLASNENDEVRTLLRNMYLNVRGNLLKTMQASREAKSAA